MFAFNPMEIFSEIIYTLIVVFFCLIIYFKTKEVLELTKHRGVDYFRKAFLFFALAYAARFAVHLFSLSTIVLDYRIPRGFPMLLSLVLTGYFSTIAIFYLVFSALWKTEKEGKYFGLISNATAIGISIMALLSRDFFIIYAMQVMLLLFAIAISQTRKKKARLSQMRIVYLLILVFWFISIALLSPRGGPPSQVQTLLQVISLSIFAFIYYKVEKWL